MNIVKFFNSQAPQHLTQTHKSKIYSDFLRKRERRNNTNRRSLVSKRLIIYSSIGICIIIGLFFYPLEKTMIKNTTNNQVMAQTIGNIIDSTGKFSISNNGRIIQSNNIQIKDMINLEKGSSIKILINDSFQTEIIGPASFEIVPIKDNNRTLYNLKFSNGGDFVAVNTKQQTTDTEISIETKEGVIIKNKDTNTEKNNISFTVIGSSRGNNTTILNKSNVSIEASKSSSDSSIKGESKITIAPTQIAELSQNTDDSNKNKDLLLLQTKPLESNTEEKILAKFTSSSDETNNTTKQITNPTLEQIPEETPEKETVEVAKLSEETKYQIEQNLYKSFIKNDIENIVTYHLIGNKSASDISRSNLSNRINRIAKILNISLNKDSDGINAIINNINEIQIGFSQQYPQEARLIYNLTVAKSRLELINIYEFGGHKDIQYTSGALDLEGITTILKIKKKERKYSFR